LLVFLERCSEVIAAITNNHYSFSSTHGAVMFMDKFPETPNRTRGVPKTNAQISMDFFRNSLQI
jgi:hypothetical protein